MRGTGRRYVLRARAEGVEQTRRRILDRAREALFTVPFDDLTLPLVAARAEVTTQTVRNHFGSKEGLLRAVSDSVAQDVLDGRRSAGDHDSASATAVLAAEYETYGRAYHRLMAAAERSPALAAMAERGREEHQRWLAAVFGHRLPDGQAARERALAALYAATDVGTWRLLRVHLGHPQRMATDVMRVLIDGALASA